MKIHIISIFPDSFSAYFGSSIMKRAIENGYIEIILHKLGDYSDKKTKRVDDKAYGTHGVIISPEPLSRAIEAIRGDKKIPIIYLSPRGVLLNQEKIEEYYKELSNEIIIICGHYEGIDERIIEMYVDYHISIGEYVITSGELASQVFIDALVRHIPGVLGNSLSIEEESFSKKLNRHKEYPQYTRPEIFMDMEVPNVLLSGNPKSITEWKLNNIK